MSVTVTDINDKTATKDTDSNGKITVPVKTTSGGSGGSSGGGFVSSTYNVTVTDKDGKAVSVTKSIKNDDITLTLPSGTELDGSNYYTITVTNRQGKAAEDIDVTLKDRDGNKEVGVTDENGQLILPNIAVTHRAYIIGYEAGCMGEQCSEAERPATRTFRPDAEITRAEFVTMAERAYSLFADVENGKENIFTDITNEHWAAEHIYTAIAMDWIKGYADGTFRPDNHITRAEVVTIVNRVTERNADMDFIEAHVSELLSFSDVKDKGYWAYAAIVEASNTHDALIFDETESWVE